MCLLSLSRIDRDLTRQVQTPEGTIRFREIKQRIHGGPLASLDSWEGVRSWLRATGPRVAESDPVLIPVIYAVQEKQEEIWFSILTYLFFDQIKSITKWTFPLDEDEGGRFSEVSWHFLQAVHRIDLTQRTRAVGKKLLNDTKHYTHSYYRKCRECLEQTCDKDNVDLIEDYPAKYATLAQNEYEIDKEKAIARLKSLVRDGALSRADFQILLGCHLYGRSLDEMADHLGVPYEAAKKRRQRAVKKLEISSPDLSPSSPESPLYIVGRSSRKEAGDAA